MADNARIDFLNAQLRCSLAGLQTNINNPAVAKLFMKISVKFFRSEIDSCKL